MLFQDAQFQFCLLLLTIIPCPNGKGRSFRTIDAQLGDAVDDLEQPAGHPADGADHPAVGRYLPHSEDRGHDQGQKAEGHGHAAKDGVVEKDDNKGRQQGKDRQNGIGVDALHGVAEILESHAPHRQVASRVTVQHARRQPEQSVPERRFEPGCRAPFEAHQRHALQDVQHYPDQRENRQCCGRRIEQPGVAAWNDVIRNEAQHQGRQQHDQTAGQAGQHQARQIDGQPLSGDPEQIGGSGAGGRQRSIEQPGVGAQPAGAFGRHTGAAPADGIDLLVAPQQVGHQRHGPAVLRSKGQHRITVAEPPFVFPLEPHLPGTNAGRIQNVIQADS